MSIAAITCWACRSKKIYRRMTIAAVTMVWNDAWFLKRWLAYFAPRLGAQNLHVFAHGGEPDILALCHDVNVTVLPRDQITVDFDIDRWAFLSHVTSGLTRFYDTVICLDVDELLIPTAPGSDLVGVLNALPPGKIWAVPGFELFPADPDGPGIGPDDLIAPQCPSALFSPFYSKTSIAGREVRFTPGGHGLFDTPPDLLTDLALVHLRFVNPSEHRRRNDLRRQLADNAYRAANVNVRDMRPSGRLVSWKAAKVRHAAVFDLFAATPQLDWATGFPQVTDQLAGLRLVRRDEHSFGSHAAPNLRLHLPDHALSLF